jgi:alpha-glucosidase (family GH31 glycosyl hydrolase)
MGKEPWKYSAPIEKIATENLRFRHKLLPYIYTMNRRTQKQGRAICEPMYYTYPKEENAYKAKNEYFFGTELIVAPITEHTNQEIGMASADVWLPEGRYTDIYNGRIYSGNSVVKMFRDISTIPVLAKEGTIIPMSKNDKLNTVENPVDLELLIFRGNNEFRLYEDDGNTMSFEDGAYCETPFIVSEDNSTITFTVKKVEGDTSVIPEKRNYLLKFRDVINGNISVLVNGNSKDYTEINKNGFVEILVNDITPDDEVTVTLTVCTYLSNKEKKEEFIDVISKFQINNENKRLFNEVLKNDTFLNKIPKKYREPLMEITALYRG